MPYINKAPNKERTKRSKHSNRSARYYNSLAWKRLRNYYISIHPLCEECLALGISTVATEVHHIKEFLTGETDEERWQLLLDEKNLMSLCSMHHQQIHNERKEQRVKQKEVKHKY